MIDKVYKIDETKVISETFEDGETIIIDLSTGDYYSVNKTAAIIWNQIKSDNGVQKILQFFLNSYNANAKLIEQSILDIIDFLIKNNLIFESNSNNSVDILEKIVNNNEKKPFIIPEIEKFDDMKKALLADPVHDVNEDGWPNLK